MTMSDPIADMLTRIRNANTAIGSLIVIVKFPPSNFSYQLAFLTPGICPLYANSRKQILQIPYFLK